METSLHHLLHNHHWGRYNRPVVAAVPSGLSLTPLRINNNNNNNNNKPDGKNASLSSSTSH
jgi:hypothetical protein